MNRVRKSQQRACESLMRRLGIPIVAVFCVLMWLQTAPAQPAAPDEPASDVLKLNIVSEEFKERTPASVTIAGNRLAVGMCYARVSGSAGHVDIYRLQNEQWTKDQTIEPDERTAGGQFGASVSMYGDLLAIGSPSGAMDKNGAVVLFKDNGIRYEEIAFLQPEGERVIPSLGFPVVLTANLCAAVAPSHSDTQSMDRSGTVFLFQRTDEGWKAGAAISAPTEFRTSLFGTYIALSDDIIAIAATGVHVDESLLASPVFVYRRTDDRWAHEATLEEQGMKASVGPISRTVCIDDGRIAIGGTSSPPGFRVGVYQYRDGSWVESSVVMHEGVGLLNAASRVELHGNTLIVARGWWKGGSLYTYRFEGEAGEWRFEREDKSDHEDTRFGIEVACDGVHVVTVESRNEPKLATLHIMKIDESK